MYSNSEHLIKNINNRIELNIVGDALLAIRNGINSLTPPSTKTTTNTGNTDKQSSNWIWRILFPDLNGQNNIEILFISSLIFIILFPLIVWIQIRQFRLHYGRRIEEQEMHG